MGSYIGGRRGGLLPSAFLVATAAALLFVWMPGPALAARKGFIGDDELSGARGRRPASDGPLGDPMASVEYDILDILGEFGDVLPFGVYNGRTYGYGYCGYGYCGYYGNYHYAYGTYEGDPWSDFGMDLEQVLIGVDIEGQPSHGPHEAPARRGALETARGPVPVPSHPDRSDSMGAGHGSPRGPGQGGPEDHPHGGAPMGDGPDAVVRHGGLFPGDELDLSLLDDLGFFGMEGGYGRGYYGPYYGVYYGYGGYYGGYGGVDYDDVEDWLEELLGLSKGGEGDVIPMNS